MLRKILPPIWFVLLLGTALLFHYFVPASRVFDITTSSIGVIVGIIIFLVGFYLPLAASKIFAEEKTEILPTSPTNRVLVTRGPFRYSRNPMYLGIIIQLLGIAIAVGTLPFFIAALTFFLVVRFVFIPFEEEKMQRQFGEQFSVYKQTVRRWI